MTEADLIKGARMAKGDELIDLAIVSAELCCAVQHSDGYCSATGCPTPTPAEKRRSLKT